MNDRKAYHKHYKSNVSVDIDEDDQTKLPPTTNK